MLEESKKLGLRDSTAILIGGMIGSAIFSLSGVTIAGAGPAAIISWIVAAVILFFYGLQTAELSTIYPQSGGIFVFPEKALGKTEKQGKFWGWIAAWAFQFANIGGACFSAMYIGIYLSVAFPALADYGVIIGVGSVVIVGIFNLLRIAATGKVNTGMTIGLVATLGIFIVVAFTSGNWAAANFVPFFGQGTGGSWGFASAIPIAMLAYGAIVSVAFMVGDIKNPKKIVPRSMTIAMIIVVSLYVLTMVATLGLITSQYLAANPGMTYIPMYAAAFTQLMAIPWITALISISAVLALLTTMLVVMMLAGITFQASAEGGMLPKGLAKLNKSGTPVNAQILVIIITGILAAFPNLVNVIVNLGALCNVIVVAIISITVVAARKKNPDVVGRFKAPGGSAVSIIVLAVLVICYIPSIMQGGLQLWGWTGVYYAVGLAIFFIATRKRGPQIESAK